MQCTRRLAAAGILAVTMAAAVGAHAADADALPPAHIAGHVTFLSGGIGLDESTAIKRAARSYPLELEFLMKGEPRDVYVADVHVRIRDDQGRTVLDTVANGPFLLARLPAGRYDIVARSEGRSQSRHISLAPGEHLRVPFEWATA